MSAPTPDAQSVACPRCGSVIAVSDLGVDRRCPSCARILPPSALEGIVQVPAPARRPTREHRAAQVPVTERAPAAPRNEVRPSTGIGLTTEVIPSKGKPEATVIKPLPKAPGGPTATQTLPSPPPLGGEGQQESTQVTPAPKAPEEPRTEPPAPLAKPASAQNAPRGRTATREALAVEAPKGNGGPAGPGAGGHAPPRGRTREFAAAAAQVDPAHLPPGRKMTKEAQLLQGLPAASATVPAPVLGKESTTDPANPALRPAAGNSGARRKLDADGGTARPPPTKTGDTPAQPGGQTIGERPRSRTREAPAVSAPSTPATPRKGTSREVPAKGHSVGADGNTLPPSVIVEADADMRPADAISTPPMGVTAVAPEDGQERGPEGDLQEEMVLGGYKLLKRIGSGGMGAVWLARQLSLDRNVALKILHGDMADDPHFVVRFNREAVAAGQLVHHNIVQIHDIGADRGMHFFSMEFVDGETLGSIVRREGKLDAEVAAGYVLQAARGLHYAHQHGMVHRDVKPDNILLNRHGVVKVADLGLVKLRGALVSKDKAEHTVKAEMAMGTPAYIAPEQVMDPAGVDHRADIYSLGCTFYELLTGRVPFEADSAAAMLTKHVYDAPVPAQDVVKRIPPALAETVARMMAKAPEQRQASMAEVVRELEAFLGVDGSAAFSPREEHADQLERCVQTFNASRWNKYRFFGLIGVLVALAIPLGVLGFLKLWLWMGLVAAGSLFFWLTAFILRGVTQKTALFIRVRQHVLGARVTVWFLEFVSLVGAGLAIHTYRIHWHALGTVGIGVALGIIWYFVFDRRVAQERRKPIEEIERMLRGIRLRGLDETALRQFVCKYSGENWEPFYEQLFGYDAMMLAREKWGRNDRDLQRQRHATWRDPIIRFIDNRQRLRQERRSLRLLRKLEKRKQKAEQATSPAK